MLLDYRWLWEEGVAPDALAPRARVPADDVARVPAEDRRAVVEPDRRVVAVPNP